MPQLKSGRHVALSISPYIKAVSTGRYESRFFAIVALRCNVPTPDALRDHVFIGHFGDNNTPTAQSACFSTGLCVDDVLRGWSDWTTEEVEEFRLFLDEPRVQRWLGEQFDSLNNAIRDNHIWGSGGMLGEPDAIEADIDLFRRKIICMSAMREDAMNQVRRSALKL